MAAESQDPPDSSGLVRGVDGLLRCFWAGDHADYVRYHDIEWGHPVVDDKALFEKICLEGFQSGLSWLTILRKRENFREAFDGFDYELVAKYTEADVTRLLGNAGIVRHRGKIEATINNARRAVEMAAEVGSLHQFFWSWEPSAEDRPRIVDRQSLLALTKSKESVGMSKALKKRGWRFVGPVTAYAFMQAMGLVNDHVEGCHSKARIDARRQELHVRRVACSR